MREIVSGLKDLQEQMHLAAVVPDLSTGAETFLDLRRQRSAAIERLQEIRKSCVFVFWTLESLQRKDFLTLVDMLEEENPSVDIDLIVSSSGGSGETGYRIGHAFQGWTKRKGMSFRVIVPLSAMSAATLLSLGAQEIVMGLSSEIGPIDPQVERYDQAQGRWIYVPALAVLDGLKLVSEYIQKIPPMSKFFEEIMRNENLTLVNLGLLERMRETGKQQAEALLVKGMLSSNPGQAREVSDRLTDYYKYHGHPIDAFEAQEDLKLAIKHSSGEEWQAIKALRDQFQYFVGRPGIIPGGVVSCAIETARRRNWRYWPTERGQQNVSPRSWERIPFSSPPQFTAPGCSGLINFQGI